MFKKLFTRSRSMFPQFRHMTGYQMLPGMLNQLGNPYLYTPKIQKIRFTDELAKYLAFLTRKQTVFPKDLRQLTQNILTEYGTVYQRIGLEGQKYGFQRNYKIQQDDDCPYHGTVDYMVYLNKTHFFPVMFFQGQLNPFTGAALAYSNMKMKAKLRQQPKTSGFSLITNGQEWILYKMYRNMHLQKSVMYEGKNKFRNIYEDYEMVSVTLGLIDCCLDVKRDDVETLKIAYDFIDEQRFMLEAKQGEKIKENWFSKMLKRYYEKKRDWNSK